MNDRRTQPSPKVLLAIGIGLFTLALGCFLLTRTSGDRPLPAQAKVQVTTPREITEPEIETPRTPVDPTPESKPVPTEQPPASPAAEPRVVRVEPVPPADQPLAKAEPEKEKEIVKEAKPLTVIEPAKTPEPPPEKARLEEVPPIKKPEPAKKADLAPEKAPIAKKVEPAPAKEPEAKKVEPAPAKEPAKKVDPPAKAEEKKVEKPLPVEVKKIPGIDALTARPFDIPLNYNKQVPEGIADLKAMQDQVNAAWVKVLPAIVGVRMGPKAGSAVLVKGGYALTAGHVCVQSNINCTLIFPDGKNVKAKTLGLNKSVDGGLMQIQEEGDWPYVEMGNAADLKVGQWVICAGHPGGYRDGRPPPVRVGRILGISASTISTDCAMVGGDSGGPLFDLQGRVIGINSRIGQGIAQNMHVNINTFRDGWEKLVQAETVGQALGQKPAGPAPYLGIRAGTENKSCKILLVREGSPAEKGGLKEDDVVLKFEGKAVNDADDFLTQIRKKQAGDEISLEIRRGEETLMLKIVLGKG